MATEMLAEPLQLGDNLHHALFHGDLDVFSPPDRTHAGQTHPEHLRNNGFVLVDHLPDLVELALCQHGMDQIPHPAVYAPGAVKVKPALDGNGHTSREHKQNRVHEHPTLLKKFHHCLDSHSFPPGF
jgi:hypothetical protein